MNINPTLDRVVIKKCNFDDVYESKVILITSAKNDINRLIHEVVEVGPGGIVNGHDIKMVLKPGDKVIVPEYIGSEIHIDDEDYRIVRQSDVLAVLE